MIEKILNIIVIIFCLLILYSFIKVSSDCSEDEEWQQQESGKSKKD